jgi:hypothetical protein
MSIVVLCQLGLLNDAARQKLFETARLAMPYSGAELLFAGDEIPGGDEPRRSTFALSFHKIDEAHQFMDKMRGIDFRELTGFDVELQLLKLSPPTIGQLPLMLFP